MKLIRNNVFETNSSSCHTVTISDKVLPYDTIYPESDGVIYIESEDFGWSFEDRTNPHDKLSYIFIYLMKYYNIYSYEDRIKISREEYDKLEWSEKSEHLKTDEELFNEYIKNSKQFKLLKKVVCEHTGANDLIPKLPCGYIDHQSIYDKDLVNIFDNEKELKSFLFNPKSYLLTGNDNSNYEWIIEKDGPKLELF